MRWITSLVLASILLPSFANAQGKEKFKPPEIKKVQVGFQTFQEDERTSYKVGLWTPIYVELFGGTDGIKADESGTKPYLEIETVDSEEVGTKIRVIVDVEPEKQRTFIGYVKTGHMGRNLSELTITLHANGRKFTPRSFDPPVSEDIDRHLYLTLGRKMLGLNNAVRKLDQVNKGLEKDGPIGFDSHFRQIVFETDAERLPDVWFGYNGIDLMILTTGNRKFLTALQGNPEKVRAIAQWVRRGGRLIVPIAPENQDVVAKVLASEVWDPRIPVVPPGEAPKDQEPGLPRLFGLETWARAIEPYQQLDPRDPLNKVPIPIAALADARVQPGDWTVLATSSEDAAAKPLIAQVRYGLGQIIYIAVSLEDSTFTSWNGKEKFLQTMINEFAPKAPAGAARNDGFMGKGGMVTNDISTQLLANLDQFDVTPIPFALVAVFIVIYIMVVGPLDFFLLKYVFKRLEWTWITFPSVVLAVSIIAYFAAYALKGRDLKINKVDIVDFDLRTSADKGKPTNARAYGHSFFTILSPRIQNYTIGMEPNPLFWGAEPKQVKRKDGTPGPEVLSVDLMSWMGRPSGGMHDMGRGGSAGFFRRPYGFRDDASGLEGVPIPVWTTKAFSASWEQKLETLPFMIDLRYHTREVEGKDFKITGKIENHLGADLVDVWLLYNDRFYPVEGGLKSMKNGGAAKPIALVEQARVDIGRWVSQEGEAAPQRLWTQDPTLLVKQLLFNERYDLQGTVRNHLLRPLDLSWRVHEEPRDTTRRTREAILFGRVAYANGKADALMRSTTAPLPTKLWLGEFPDRERSFPSAPGDMNQDSYVRVILPLRSGDE
jgi:hypothetical protein